MKGEMQDKPKKASGKSSADKGDVAEVLSLRDIRESRGIGLDEVAHDLHLSREVVLALEEGDYESLGAAVFVRGHLRSYARLLDLSEDDVLQGLQASEPAPEEFRTLSARIEVKSGASLSGFVLWVILGIIIVVAGVYLLLDDDEESAAKRDVKGDFQKTEAVESVSQADVTDDETDTNSQAIDAAGNEQAPASRKQFLAAPVEDFEPAAPVEKGAEQMPEKKVVAASPPAPIPKAKLKPTPVAEVVVVAPEPAAAPPAVVPGAVFRLIVTFAEECWVEISDSKRRLLYGLEKSGSVVKLVGTPPFKLFLGNAPGVSIELAGKPFVIPRSRRGGNTARFSISKDKIQ
jgi:cytoskeleton protein RodZ